jgi:hypothetical protein
MHTKIKTHQIDPNFLAHEPCPKTKLKMQHKHLELLWILSYAIIRKNKHKSRINIYDNYKIVNNSLGVYFGINRQHAVVGHKNLIIVATKIIWTNFV